MTQRPIVKCEDCLAYHNLGSDHICPAWLKELVRQKKEKDLSTNTEE